MTHLHHYSHQTIITAANLTSTAKMFPQAHFTLAPFSHGFEDDEMELFITSQALHLVAELDLSTCLHDSLKFVQVFFDMGMHALKKLTLNTHKYESQEVLDILGHERLSSLESLTVIAGEIGNEVCRQVVKGPFQLKELAITHSTVDTKGVETLASSTCWQELQLLNLSCNQLTTESVSHLSKSYYFQKLIHLNLSQNMIDAQGASSIASTPWASQLDILNMSYNNLGTEGVMALVNSMFLKDSIRKDFATWT